MHIVSNGDNLHEMSNPIFLGKNKKNITNFSSAELAKRVEKMIQSIAEMKNFFYRYKSSYKNWAQTD